MVHESSFPISPLHVMAISPGVAIGPIRLYKVTSVTVEDTKISPSQVEAEQQRLLKFYEQQLASFERASQDAEKLLNIGSTERPANLDALSRRDALTHPIDDGVIFGVAEFALNE